MKVEWLAQDTNTEGGRVFNSRKRAMDKIAAMTDGQFTIDYRGGGAIVPGWEEVPAAERGVLDFGVTASFVHNEVNKAATLFNAVLGSTMFPIKMQSWMLNYGHDLYTEMLADAGKTVVTLPGWEGTPEMFLNTNKPLNTVKDLEGLKVRTAGDDAAIFSMMGASPTSVPPPEIYENMQRGVIDAFQLNAPSIDKSISLYEVVDYTYVSPIRQPAEYHVFYINRDSWNNLPDNFKVIWQAAVLEEAYRYLNETIVADAEAIDFYIDYGVTVGPPPKEIEDEFIRNSKIFYGDLAAADPFFARVWQSIQDFEKAYDTTYPSGL
jgi:TRAP-type mannitol/chloroaromatic compound transport system substrate-binding protein